MYTLCGLLDDQSFLRIKVETEAVVLLPPHTLHFTPMNQTDQINEINQPNQIDQINQIDQTDEICQIEDQTPFSSRATSKSGHK